MVHQWPTQIAATLTSKKIKITMVYIFLGTPTFPQDIFGVVVMEGFALWSNKGWNPEPSTSKRQWYWTCVSRHTWCFRWFSWKCKALLYFSSCFLACNTLITRGIEVAGCTLQIVSVQRWVSVKHDGLPPTNPPSAVLSYAYFFINEHWCHSLPTN